MASATIDFDLPFEHLGEFLAGAGKHLDAVVLERIVRGRNDDAGGVAHARREIGDGRRRHDAGAGQGRRPGWRCRTPAHARSSRPTRACRSPTENVIGAAPGATVVTQGADERGAEPPHRLHCRAARRRLALVHHRFRTDATCVFIRSSQRIVDLDRRRLDANHAHLSTAARRGHRDRTVRRAGRSRPPTHRSPTRDTRARSRGPRANTVTCSRQTTCVGRARIANLHRHAVHSHLHRRRGDGDGDSRDDGVSQPHRRIGRADGDHVHERG